MHYLVVLTEDGHVQEMRFEQITLGHQDCCSKLKYHHAELKLIVFFSDDLDILNSVDRD